MIENEVSNSWTNLEERGEKVNVLSMLEDIECKINSCTSQLDNGQSDSLDSSSNFTISSRSKELQLALDNYICFLGMNIFNLRYCISIIIFDIHVIVFVMQGRVVPYHLNTEMYQEYSSRLVIYDY
jgi:hypothetical protein